MLFAIQIRAESGILKKPANVYCPIINFFMFRHCELQASWDQYQEQTDEMSNKTELQSRMLHLHVWNSECRVSWFCRSSWVQENVYKMNCSRAQFPAVWVKLCFESNRQMRNILLFSCFLCLTKHARLLSFCWSQHWLVYGEKLRLK